MTTKKYGGSTLIEFCFCGQSKKKHRTPNEACLRLCRLSSKLDVTDPKSGKSEKTSDVDRNLISQLW
jgi:hypothetical protein